MLGLDQQNPTRFHQLENPGDLQKLVTLVLQVQPEQGTSSLIDARDGMKKRRKIPTPTLVPKGLRKREKQIVSYQRRSWTEVMRKQLITEQSL